MANGNLMPGLLNQLFFRKVLVFSSCGLLLLPSFLFSVEDTSKIVAIGQTNQASVSQRKITEEQKQPSEARLEEPKIEIQTKEPKKEALPSMKLFVHEILLEGNSVFTTQELSPLIAPYQKRETTFEELKALTQAISQKYHGEGYRTSFAYLPRQQIQKGVIRIAVIEGKVGDIIVEGNHYHRKKIIRSYVKLEPDEILNIKKIQAALRRLNEIPDLEVGAKLVAGEKPKTSNIILTVNDRLPVHGSFNYDNEGSKSSGQHRYHLITSDQNLTGHNDALSAGTVFGHHFGFFFTQYQIPILQTDTKFNAGFSYGQSTPKGNLIPFGVNSTSQLYSSGIQQVIFRGQHVGASLSGGIEFMESRTLVLAGTYTRERLRVLSLTPGMIIGGSRQTTSVIPEFRFGVNGFGASIHADPQASRQGVEPNFFVSKAKVYHNQDLMWDMSASIQIEAQHPSRKLPSQEALSLGGASTVRGYPEADYLADTGIRYSVDYLIPTYFFPADWQLPSSKIPLRKQVQAVVFFDQSYGRLRGPSDNEERMRHLMGAGGGIRIKLYDHVTARFEWAVAAGDEPLGNGNLHEFHFRIETEPIDGLRDLINGIKAKNTS